MTVNPASGNVPLLEFDSDRSAFIDPAKTQPKVDAPAAAIACFFPETIEEMTSQGHRVLELPSREPLWEIEYRGKRLGLFYPGLGAPLASNSMERVIAAGCRTIIACGGAGAMRQDLRMGHHAIVVTAAVRDEGTSYHYLPPAREVVASPDVVAALTAVVNRRGIPTIAGRTWTTDGLFRETPRRVARRRAEGCLTVEMEASALLAVAEFRSIQFGQLLYAGDDLSGEVWDDRDWRQAVEVRRLLVDLAAETALALANPGQASAGSLKAES
ncbi:nucleoside phosphorylase [Micromonospora sp. NBC_01412]|uniref:nucleoside phosphorylase n=1 Tax=Micromonospora sp. NBC_01412 TaxID=2903590 RepID=UPI00324D5C0D